MTRRQILLMGLGAMAAPAALARVLVSRKPAGFSTFVRAHFVPIAPPNGHTWRSIRPARAEAGRMIRHPGSTDKQIRTALSARISGDLDRRRMVVFAGVRLTLTEAAIQVILEG